MAELYFYVQKTKLRDVVDCGLKLSEWYDREVSLPGFIGTRRVVKALLNPSDDKSMAKNTNYQCLRLNVALDYCVVGDETLYAMGLNNSAFMDHYRSNIVPLRDYRFGTFRHPGVLIMTSVLPDCIEVTGAVQDIPVLYESSEALYLNSLLEKHEEQYQDSGNHLLYAFYTYLESKGEVTRFDDGKRKYAVFIKKDSNDYKVFKIP